MHVAQRKTRSFLFRVFLPFCGTDNAAKLWAKEPVFSFWERQWVPSLFDDREAHFGRNVCGLCLWRVP